MDDASLPHPTDAFLLGNNAPPPNAHLRQAVLMRTTRVLRRRRWWRRARLAGALAACYLAGILTMRYALPSGAALPPHVAGQSLQPAAPGEQAIVKTEAASQDETALALEWRAFESAEKRAELYRLAGDRYLEREGDLPSALRCYRQALDSGSQDALTLTTTDNWLLMALKEARQKEKDHARNGS